MPNDTMSIIEPVHHGVRAGAMYSARFIRLPLWLLLVFAAWPLSPCFAEDEDSQSLTVEPTVSKAIEGLVSVTASRPLRQVEYQSALAPSGVTTDASATYEFISKNVWGVTTVQRIKTGVIQTRTVSLCGLIELVGASTSVMQFENSIPVPIGRIFIPMGMRVTKTLASHSRTATLRVPSESSNLCAPQPGDVFTYSIQTDTTLRTPSRSPKVLSNSFEWRCTAGTVMTSGALEAIWSGSHIPVSCTTTNTATGKPVVADYEYLVDAGFYLKLSTVSDMFQEKTKYFSLESAN